jgi:hypothetical protein
MGAGDFRGLGEVFAPAPYRRLGAVFGPAPETSIFAGLAEVFGVPAAPPYVLPDLVSRAAAAGRSPRRTAPTKTLLSLFDFTGAWARPFEQAGWNVLQVDIKHGDDVRDFSARWLVENVCQGFVVDGVVASPPCTDFARSGAAHWAAKDADGRTAASVHLVYQVLRTVDFLRPDFWALENPIGRIARLVPELGTPTCVFDPCDFAGWTEASRKEWRQLDALRARHTGSAFTAQEVALVKRTNAYTKRTALWGCFRCPTFRRVEPVRTSKQGSWLQQLGGAGERTKEARSVTPAGFARAFYAANHDALACDWENA